MVCPLAFGEVGVKERVKSVLNYKKPTLWIMIATAAVLVLFGTDFFVRIANGFCTSCRDCNSDLIFFCGIRQKAYRQYY